MDLSFWSVGMELEMQSSDHSCSISRETEFYFGMTGTSRLLIITNVARDRTVIIDLDMPART